MPTTRNPPGDPETDEPTINEVLDAFLQERKIDKATSTYHNNKGHLDHFRAWCDQLGYTHFSELSPHQMLQYKLVLKQDDNKKPKHGRQLLLLNPDLPNVGQ